MSDAIDVSKSVSYKIKEHGDFQTPKELTDKICNLIRTYDFEPTVLIEPSCGKGNFVISALESFPTIKLVIAIEMQEHYEEEFNFNISQSSIDIVTKQILFIQNSFFNIDFNQIFLQNNISAENEKFLLIGNPPWVTNSFLGSITSANLPEKSNNISKLKGLDALTGKSNFDIAETFITKLFDLFKEKNFLLSMICKTATAQSIIKNNRVLCKYHELQTFLFDATRYFGVSTSANNLLIIPQTEQKLEQGCSVRLLDSPKSDLYSFGYKYNHFVSNMDLYNKYSDLEGNFPYQWRQGLKHDAGSILVLERLSPGLFKNKLGEKIELEEDLIYPFIKSSDVKGSIIEKIRYFIIVPQTKLGEDNEKKLVKYPKTWNYLCSKISYFSKRKSKIYANKSTFCIFGVGEYSFKPFKIVVSGFYKELQFSLLLPYNEKEVMIDDTCYSLSFDTLEETLLVWILLNTSMARDFFKAIVFLSSKRPYKKENLQRLDLRKLMLKINLAEFQSIFNNLSQDFLSVTFDQILTAKNKLA